jgi:acetyl esterase/lipase
VSWARRRLDRGILLRSLLGAISVVLAILPAVVAIGAFLPWIDTIGRFGALVVTHLPALLVEASLAASVAALALVLGGGRWTRLLVGITTSTAMALLVVAGVTTAFAWQLNVPFDFFHMARASATPPVADERVVFATVEGIDLHADIWHARPPDPASAAGGATGDAARPAIVYVHGGAFVSGVLGSRRELFAAVVAAGISLIDVEYRLTGPPRWQDAPADVMCALRWTAAHAPELGIDPAKIVLAGESAGGNLAMLVGYAASAPDGGGIQPSCDGAAAGAGAGAGARAGVRVAGVFAVAPTADLAGIWADHTLSALDRPFPEAYIGGPPAEFPDRYEAASPLHLVRAGLPPTYLLTGANDHFVLPNRVTAVADRLREAGAPVTVVVAPFAEHGFDGFPNGYGNQLQEVLLPRFVVEVTR